MKKNSVAKVVEEDFEDIVNDAISGATQLRPLVYVPPFINGKKTRVVLKENKGRTSDEVSIRGQIVRIHTQGDPLGFLMAAMNGQLFRVIDVDSNGNPIVSHIQATLGQRISIAKYLGDKVMPKLHLVKHDGADEPGERSFNDIVDVAANLEDSSEDEGN